MVLFCLSFTCVCVLLLYQQLSSYYSVSRLNGFPERLPAWLNKSVIVFIILVSHVCFLVFPLLKGKKNHWIQIIAFQDWKVYIKTGVLVNNDLNDNDLYCLKVFMLKYWRNLACNNFSMCFYFFIYFYLYMY